MKKLLNTRVFGSLLVAFSMAGCGSFSSPDPVKQKSFSQVSEVKSMLWVGNSFFYYNNSMHGHVGQLLNAAGGKDYRATSATISGSGVNWHDIEAHFKPNAVGSYSFVGDNEVRFNTLDRPFDATMMLDCSQCPIHPKLQTIFYETVKKHSETVRKHGSEPILFMTWAYSDKPEMTDQLAAEYIKAGKINNALVVPAGLAFANSNAKRPDLSLIIADKRHPSLMGTYLAACTVMASVYKQNPIGNKYTAGLPPAVATHLQTVAWETVRNFHTTEGRGSL
ncbi:MAG: DUF4886 domain-containing protein [Burkholderiaceae bacterium]